MSTLMGLDGNIFMVVYLPLGLPAEAEAQLYMHCDNYLHYPPRSLVCVFLS